jgi:perosamine synthetase
MLHVVRPRYDEREKRAVAEYMNSGGWLTEHKKTREFEAAVADFLGAKHCVAFSNGTVTLFAALAALGIGPGDEVIVPDYTFVASATAVSLAGAKPVFVDVSPSNLCLDLAKVPAAITTRAKAVMAISMNGRAPDMGRLREIAENYGLYIVEDAAQSFGSKHAGRFLGTFGAAGSFSFSSMKIVATGQGGALVTDDDDLATRFRRIKNFGRPSPGSNRHVMPGYNFKITDLQAVIGLEQLKKLPYRISHKKAMFQAYRDELKDIEEVRFIETDLETITPWVADVLVPNPAALQKHLKNHGISARLGYPPCHGLPFYDFAGYFPVSDFVSKHGLWLPSSSHLDAVQIRRVCGTIKEFYA